jgi:adenylate cyclase
MQPRPSAARHANVATVSLGSFEVHNIADPVELWDVVLCPAPSGGSVDPVCRMYVERTRAAGRLRHEETDFWFCSPQCAAIFAASPERFTVQWPVGADRGGAVS